MTAFVERNSIGAIERGCADDTAKYLYKLWKSENGGMPASSELKALSPFLVIFEDLCIPGDSPEILFNGASTLLSNHYPEITGDPMDSPKSVLQDSYRNLVSAGYQDAISGEPVFETVGTGSLLGDGKPSLIYERVLLRFKKRRAGDYIIGYSIKRSETWLCPTGDQKDQLQNSRQTSGHHQSLPGDRPSVFHGHALA